MNRWNIPDWLEREVIERDKCCIYCGVHFVSGHGTRKSKPTWEHIINDARIVNRENIARCCFSCNASKGTKKLADWLQSKYCKTLGITENTIAEVARNSLLTPPNNDIHINNERIYNEVLALSPEDRTELTKLTLLSLDSVEQKCIMEELKKCRQVTNHFALTTWLQQAKDDLEVAKTLTVPSFIRCYHAQQSMEKVLKAAFVVVYGKFHDISQALLSERKYIDVSLTNYIPSCAWELNTGVNFPYSHNLIYLWKKLGEGDQIAFGPLNKEQKQFMKKASDYAVDYRYPYFSKNTGLQVSFIPESDVQEVVSGAEVIHSDVLEYICRQTTTRGPSKAV